jgi:hypothetical protein
MHFISSKGLVGADLDRVEFWNKAHSVGMVERQWCLALWCSARPQWASPGSRRSAASRLVEPVVGFGWPRRMGERVSWSEVPLREVVDSIDRLDVASEVVLARRDLPTAVLQELERRFGYTPGLRGQVSGWWLDDEDPAPTLAPAWQPTGALVTTRRDGALRPGDEALILVEVDDWWAVLSEYAMLTYSFGAALFDGRPIRFAANERGTLRCWFVGRVDTVDRSQVARRFGDDVAQRARPDAPSVLVRVNAEAQ